MLTLPRKIYSPGSGPNRNQHSFLHSKKCYLHSIPVKKTLSFHFKCSPFENTILDKNVKKNARCMFNFRILPSKARFTQDTPPSPPKNNVEVWPEHFCCLLNNIDQGGVGGGVTMVPNSQGWSPVSKKEQNS